MKTGFANSTNIRYFPYGSIYALQYFNKKILKTYNDTTKEFYKKIVLAKEYENQYLINKVPLSEKVADN